MHVSEQEQNKIEDGQDNDVLPSTDAETAKPTKRGGKKIRKVVRMAVVPAPLLTVTELKPQVRASSATRSLGTTKVRCFTLSASGH
jgi:hypothetical protein